MEAEEVITKLDLERICESADPSPDDVKTAIRGSEGICEIAEEAVRTNSKERVKDLLHWARGYRMGETPR